MQHSKLLESHYRTGATFYEWYHMSKHGQLLRNASYALSMVTDRDRMDMKTKLKVGDADARIDSCCALHTT